MTETLSARGRLLLEAARRNLELIREHEKVSVAEAEAILAMMVVHIRSWRPMALLVTENTP